MNEESINWGINELKILPLKKNFGVSGDGIKIAILDSGLDKTNDQFSGAVKESFDFHEFKCEVTEDTDIGKHGTHVAGIIGNRDRTLGIAHACDLYIGKIYDDLGKSRPELLASAVSWATKIGVDIINISQQVQECSGDLHRAIRIAKNSGIIIVSAAGNIESNDGMSVQYPGAFQETSSFLAGGSKNRTQLSGVIDCQN